MRAVRQAADPVHLKPGGRSDKARDTAVAGRRLGKVCSDRDFDGAFQFLSERALANRRKKNPRIERQWTLEVGNKADLNDPFSGYGQDISSVEKDELDRRCLEVMGVLEKTKKRLTMVDLGCGKGIQGVRFALSGHRSFLYDLKKSRDLARMLAISFPICKGMKFIECDLRSCDSVPFPRNIDVIYSQRFIHYLNWDQSTGLLRRIRLHSSNKAFLFLSAAGRDTEIGLSHPKRNAPLNDRLALPSAEMQEKHKIFKPLCIYSCNELNIMASAAGFVCIEFWESEFGNVKAIYRKS